MLEIVLMLIAPYCALNYAGIMCACLPRSATFDIRNLTSVICHPSSVVRHLSFGFGGCGHGCGGYLHSLLISDPDRAGLGHSSETNAWLKVIMSNFRRTRVAEANKKLARAITHAQSSLVSEFQSILDATVGQSPTGAQCRLSE